MTLEDFVGPGTFIAPRVMEETLEGSAFSGPYFESVSGHLISVAGSVPIVCHEAAVPSDGLSAMADCGIELPGEIETYRTREEYLTIIRSRLGMGEKAWFTFPQPEGMAPGSQCVVPIPILARLNDKRHLPELTPEENVLPRRLFEGVAAVREELSKRRHPTVVKTADSSGGAGVMVVKSGMGCARALRKFGGSSHLIFEKYIDARANFCMQFAILPEGELCDLGGSLQICHSRGSYLGNRILPYLQPSEATRNLARRIASSGAALGFRGIAGFDILEDREGRSFAVDLNFRPNVSTPFLLLHARFRQERNLPFAELAAGQWTGPLSTILRTLKSPMKEGWLVPVGFFDPSLIGMRESGVRLRLLVMATSGGELDHHINLLKRAGFHLWSRRRTARDRIGRLSRQLAKLIRR